MDRTERFYKIDQMIHDRKLVPFVDLMAALEVSRATLKRDLEYMRNRLNAPIVWDREAGGYRFDTPHAEAGAQYELPGLWFNSGEVHALLTMQHLLTDLDPGGILTPHIRPLIARLNSLLGTAENTAEEIRRRVLIVGLGKRELKLAHFEKVGAALLRRKRLAITYFARGSGETTEREVSPQRLVYYRQNWYLDAWCHLRNDIRNFSLDSIRECNVIESARRARSRIAAWTKCSAPATAFFPDANCSMRNCASPRSARAGWRRKPGTRSRSAGTRPTVPGCSNSPTPTTAN
jgi:predicted DNA-binding transcriptional regulator YafY